MTIRKRSLTDVSTSRIIQVGDLVKPRRECMFNEKPSFFQMHELYTVDDIHYYRNTFFWEDRIEVALVIAVEELYFTLLVSHCLSAAAINDLELKLIPCGKVQIFSKHWLADFSLIQRHE